MPRRSKPLKFADLHCGIGALRLALEDVGAECVWSYTADAKARRCYCENFGDGTADDIPAHDILVANLDECANTAKRRKSAQRPHQMVLDVVCLHRPLACLLAGKADGVSTTSRAALIEELVRLGYFVHRTALDAKRFGLPQTGPTDFIVAFDRETGFRFPPGSDQKAIIDDLLERQPHDRYYISEASRDKLIARRSRSMNNGNKWHMGFVTDGLANSLSDAPDALYDNVLILPNGSWRALTEREVGRLNGVPDSFVIHPEWRTARKQLARCIPVPVAAAVAAQIVAELRPGFRTGEKQASAKVVSKGSRIRKPRGTKPQAKSDAASGCGSPLRWYGSLNGYASKIVSLFPQHKFYCEVFGGSAAILLSKPPSKIETYNDVDEKLVGFWRVIREKSLRDRLVEMIALTPFSRVEFHQSISERDTADDPVTDAWRFLVASNQSRNGCAKNESDWAYNKSEVNNSNAWATLPTRLAEVGQRLKCVQVESLPFEDVLRRYDSRDAFYMLDPPFLPETRESSERYTHECSRDDHVRLLRIARGLDATVALCAYRSDLYDDLLDDWHRTDIKGKSYAGPRTKGRKLPDRVLSVYMNYEPPSQ